MTPKSLRLYETLEEDKRMYVHVTTCESESHKFCHCRMGFIEA